MTSPSEKDSMLEPLGAPIGRVMTRNPASLPVSASLYDAAQLMVQRGIRHVLVVGQGVLTRVISERSLFTPRAGVRRTASPPRSSTSSTGAS